MLTGEVGLRPGAGSSDRSCEVPGLAQLGEDKLPPRALAYLNIRTAVELVGTAVAACSVILWTLGGNARLFSLAALATLTLVGLAVELPLLNRLRLRYTSYSVNARYVYITRGAIIRSSVLIPVHQILNVETVQGPLLRRFVLAKVRFQCITDVEALGPLDPAAVAAIRRAVASSRQGSA